MDDELLWLEELVDRIDPPPPHLTESIRLLIMVSQVLGRTG